MNPVPEAPPLPEGLSVKPVGEGVILSISWRNMASWALLPLALVAVAIPVSLFSILRELPWNDPMQLLVVVFGVVGLIFSYMATRRLVNVTELEVTPERLRIRHGPLPWRRPFEVAMETIRSVEVRRFQWRYDGGVATHYHVWAVHADGRETCLLERDTDAEQATLVRDEIQRVLDAAATHDSQAVDPRKRGQAATG